MMESNLDLKMDELDLKIDELGVKINNESNLLDKVGSLEEEALKRKQRLLSLKNKRKLNDENNEDNEDKKTGNLPKPVFRSYAPSDDNLKEGRLAKAKPESVEDHIKDQLNALKDKNIIEEIDINNLAPKKVDWDLKRNIDKDLQKLERRTDKVIADLARERLKNEQLNTQ